MSLRCGAATLPWCARTRTSPASSLTAPEIRSARRRLLTKMMVERWARTCSRSLGWMALQMEARRGPCDAGPLGRSSSSSSFVMSSSGTSTQMSRRFGALASTMVTGAPPAQEPGHFVERPLRCR